MQTGVPPCCSACLGGPGTQWACTQGHASPGRAGVGAPGSEWPTLLCSSGSVPGQQEDPVWHSPGLRHLSRSRATEQPGRYSRWSHGPPRVWLRRLVLPVPSMGLTGNTNCRNTPGPGGGQGGGGHGGFTGGAPEPRATVSERELRAGPTSPTNAPPSQDGRSTL